MVEEQLGEAGDGVGVGPWAAVGRGTDFEGDIEGARGDVDGNTPRC